MTEALSFNYETYTAKYKSHSGTLEASRFFLFLLISLIIHYLFALRLNSELIEEGGRSASLPINTSHLNVTVRPSGAVSKKTNGATAQKESIPQGELLKKNTDTTLSKKTISSSLNYFSPEELTRGPKLKENISFEKLDLANELNSGNLLLQILISEEGIVENVLTLGDPTLPVQLIDSARNAFLSARFSPGEINGRAVPCRLPIEVRYQATMGN